MKVAGTDDRYSPDNSRILHRSPPVKGGNTLNVTNPPGTVTGKGAYASWDWQP